MTNGSDPIGPILWTRGEGCGELADALSGGTATRVVGDVSDEVIRHRARLLVSRKLSGFDLAGLAVPVKVTMEQVSAVVAAVAGGPHSYLAAAVAHRLGQALGVEAFMACAYRDEETKLTAVSVIENLFRELPDLEYRLVETSDAQGLISQLPPQSMLVLGAPGGNWLQRTFFGAGAKLLGEAPAGSVVVRVAPPRVFQHMTDPVFVGPMRDAADILRFHAEPVLAVVDRAVLVGVVTRAALEEAGAGVMVGALMTEPVAVSLTDRIEAVMELSTVFDGAPVPVVDDQGLLVGSVPSR